MNVRPARLMAACTTFLLVAGIGTAVPADAASKAKATKTSVTAGRAVAGAKVTLTATVKPKAKVGTVRFTAAGKTVGSCAKVKVRSGKARCTTTFPSKGNRTVVAKYSGKAKKYKTSTGRRTIAVAAKPVVNAAAGSIVGTTGSCTTTTGALVAVSYGAWQGPIVRGCDTTPTRGDDLLSTAGFTIAQVQRQPGFVCRLGHPLFNGGAQYPTAAQTNCVNTPPTNAYWSYWLAAKGSNTWTYASVGAYSQAASNGEVQAWTFGATDVGGTTGKPGFTPDQVRAGLPASSAALRSLQSRVLATPTAPDLDAAAGYLVDKLVDGTHYDGFANTPDYGLTIDGALALAATGSRDKTLGAIVDHLADHVNDYTFITDAPGDAGRIGKLALLAESTGRNPRAFGGFDLVAEINKLECKAKNEASGCAAAGGYPYVSSLFGQTLAILGLLRAGDAATGPVAFLRSLQASSGGFPSDVSGTLIETDSTAMAAMALALVPGKAARTSLAAALKWLAGQQKANGSFPGASGDSVNSAALSIQALTLDAETYSSPIAKGRQFLGAAQNSDGGFDVSSTVEGSDIRASAQALGGAALVPFGSVLRDLRSQDDAVNGAEYLVSQLVNGNHYESSFGGQSFPDQGLTADGLFALLATGGNEQTVKAMTTYLEGQVGDYADPTGAFGGPYSGGLAKLALVAEATGGDPHNFGDTDLLKIVKDKVCTKAIPAPSEFDLPPCTAPGDFYNAFSEIAQALGIIALQASKNTADHLTFDSAPVVRLRQLQCADGGFTPVLITGDAKCVSTPDATGFAVQALATVSNADAVLGRAQHYLEKAQQAGGTYSGEAGNNSNSTALAATGLQTLITALHSNTVDPPGPKTIAPITSYQAALAGLHTFAVPAGGYGVSTNTTPDVRASAQAVLAAAQSTLVTLSGAPIASTPRDAFVADPGTPPPAGGTPPATGADGTRPNGAADAPIAETGVTASAQLGWALALLVAGSMLAFAGRRRVAVAIGRHRSARTR